VNDNTNSDSARDGMTADEIAKRSADVMVAKDEASRSLGISLVEIGPGTATMTMTVRDNMVNGHNLCHGGFIFSLADSTFAFACNSYNEVSLAMDCNITFTAPGKPGARLTAVAREIWKSGRNALYDVQVKSADGEIIAEFRGKSRTVRGTLF